MKKKFIAIWLSIILITQTFIPIASFAQKAIKEETEIWQDVKTEANNQVEQEYSEMYKDWLKLSDEEKKETIEPSKYDIPLASFDLSATESLPTKYNLKDHIALSVKNQGDYGTCYAFSSMASLETNIALTTGEYYDFSEMHFAYLSAQQLDGTRNTANSNEIITKGGDFSDFKYYINTKNGPVLETEVPYKIYEEKDYDMLKSKTAKKTITKWADFPTVNRYINITETEKEQIRNKVKEHITKYGSVYASLKADYEDQRVGNVYCSPEQGAFVNHTISIIGWDDNYSRENFPEGNRPSKDGAYIALNSWGEYGKYGGYLYISYEDDLIGTDMHGVVQVEDVKEDVKSYELLPKQYNLRDYIKINLKEYYSTGNDYAFASMTSLETNLAITTGLYYDFSEMHFIYMSAQQLGGTRLCENPDKIAFSKGEFSDFQHYIEAKKGPVIEIEVPYRTYTEREYDMLKSKVAKKTVTGWMRLPKVASEMMRGRAKEYITKYGSIYATIFASYSDLNNDKVYYPTGVEANHAISIVGWDDNYSKENFPEGNRPSKDGAYIALNPLGAHDGKDGYLYISYEDALVGDNMRGVSRVEDLVKTNFKTYGINITTKQVLENITTNQTAKFYDKDNNAVENETKLKTGMKLELGEEKYDIVVRGDLDGDGDVTITDLVKIKLHLIDKRKLTGAYLEAADTNGVGERNVTVGDMGKIILHMFGIENL